MLFITNRIPKGSIRSKAGRKFEFDLNNNDASNNLFFCERSVDGGGAVSYTEIGSFSRKTGGATEGFFARLRDSKCKQLLVYIHGFNNLPEDAFAQAAELQRLCDGEEAGHVLVVPIVWPCDNDKGIVQDYWDDQKAADQSGITFGRALNMFTDWRDRLVTQSAGAHGGTAPDEDIYCLKRINVLAHSMGNRVFRQSLVSWQRYELPGGVPMLFRSTFLMAADIVNESLHVGEDGEVITHASRNVVVYHAADDLALRASKASNLRNRIASRRLGHSGPEDMEATPNNVHAVDCDAYNTDYDRPKGHTYFLGKPDGQPGEVFRHLFQTLRRGRVPGAVGATRTTVI